jgi:hypothetical protein
MEHSYKSKEIRGVKKIIKSLKKVLGIKKKVSTFAPALEGKNKKKN